MNDLKTAMKDVAEHVDVPAHFTAAVLRGGKRRQARRRRTVAAAVVAVIGVAGVGVNALERNGPPGDSRLATATSSPFDRLSCGSANAVSRTGAR